MLNLKKIKKIHFVGIGGISQSALAKLMLSFGKDVSGSDDTLSNLTQNLEKLGIKIKKHSFPEKVKVCNLLVYTVAVKENHPDILLAKSLGIPILERAEFLGLVSNLYKQVIAVSGTHGKTTTTAMLAKILESKNPTVHIGGEVEEFGGNLKIGNKEIFLTEACEFNKSFLHLSPNISVVTNIECDHMDCYKNKTDLEQTFLQFMHKTSNFTVLNHNFLHLCDPFFANSKILTFDLDKKSDFWTTNLKEENACFSFDAFNDNFFLGKVELSVPGKHNILNALSAIAVGVKLGISFKEIQKALKNFKGVKRRFQILYNKNFQVIADYAHHPTEIKCTLEMAKLLAHKKLVCIFQPHTYSRTKFLFEEFKTCFNLADELLLLPTYPAREKESDGKTSFELFKALPDELNATYFKSTSSLEKYLLENDQTGNIILWLGAGTIFDFAKKYVKKL